MLPAINRTISLLLLAGTAWLAPGYTVAAPAGMDPSSADSFVEMCGNRIEKWFPFITIRGQELALDQVRLHQKLQVVIIPLKTPHGAVTAIHWRPKDLGEGLDVIRYLQSGKIGAVNVLPFRYHPADIYIERRELRDKLTGCEKERVEELLGKCSECEVMEWLNLKP